jgi:hypothetical protein
MGDTGTEISVGERLAGDLGKRTKVRGLMPLLTSTN